MKFLTVIAAWLLLLVNAHAATVVIDFEEDVIGSGGAILSKGFQFDRAGTTYASYSAEGTRALVAFGGYTRFSRLDATPFDLNSMWIRDTTAVLSIVGLYAGGGNIGWAA